MHHCKIIHKIIHPLIIFITIIIIMKHTETILNEKLDLQKIEFEVH